MLFNLWQKGIEKELGAHCVFAFVYARPFFSKCTMHGLLNKSFRFHLPIDYTWRFSKRFPNGIYRLAFHNSFWLFLQSSEQTATKILQWCWIYSVWFLCCIVLISIYMIKWSQFPFGWVYVSFRFSSLVHCDIMVKSNRIPQ